MTEILGLQLQFIIVPALFLGFGVIAIIHGAWYAATEMEYPFGIAALATLASALCGLIWIFLPIPYQSHYWNIYRVTGTVESVSNGFADGDGDVTYRSFVVTLEGDPHNYVITDPRASNLDGQVALTCGVEWVYLAADRWNCDIAEVTR
jgi:hypothetical protein